MADPNNGYPPGVALNGSNGPDMGYLALEFTTSFATALVELNEGRPVPLPCEAPDVLARSIAEQAATLRWSESIGGQVTDERARQLGGYLLAYMLSRARVAELDITAGGEAA